MKIPQRVPIHGSRSRSQRLTSAQFSVFFHDARTDLMLDESGNPLLSDGTVAVLDSLSAARAYAREIVERKTTLRAEIFDSQSAVDGPLEQIHSDSMRARFDPRAMARRDVQIACVLLVGFIASATYSAMQNWQSIWAYLIGTKCLIVGVFIGSRGLGWYLEKRRDKV